MGGSPPIDPDDILRRAMEAGQQIKLGVGVVGKTSRAMLGIIAMWGVIVLRLSDNWALDAVLAAAGMAVTGAFAWWVNSTQQFAERNPAQAMLEGAQLLEYQRIEAEAKGGIRDHGPLVADDSTIRAIKGRP